MPEFPRGRPPLRPPTSGPVSPRSWHGPISHARLCGTLTSCPCHSRVPPRCSVACPDSCVGGLLASHVDGRGSQLRLVVGPCVRVSGAWAGARGPGRAPGSRGPFPDVAPPAGHACREGGFSVPWWLRSALTLSASPWAHVRWGGRASFLWEAWRVREGTRSVLMSVSHLVIPAGGGAGMWSDGFPAWALGRCRAFSGVLF